MSDYFIANSSTIAQLNETYYYVLIVNDTDVLDEQIAPDVVDSPLFPRVLLGAIYFALAFPFLVLQILAVIVRDLYEIYMKFI